MVIGLLSLTWLATYLFFLVSAAVMLFYCCFVRMVGVGRHFKALILECTSTGFFIYKRPSESNRKVIPGYPQASGRSCSAYK
jgi:asparagine N-glycosylation enzyme membrane subunit Stt3